MTLTYEFNPECKDETKKKIVKYLENIEISSKIIEEGINGAIVLEVEDGIPHDTIVQIGSLIGLHEQMFWWTDRDNNIDSNGKYREYYPYDEEEDDENNAI